MADTQPSGMSTAEQVTSTNTKVHLEVVDYLNCLLDFLHKSYAPACELECLNLYSDGAMANNPETSALGRGQWSIEEITWRIDESVRMRNQAATAMQFLDDAIKQIAIAMKKEVPKDSEHMEVRAKVAALVMRCEKRVPFPKP